MSHHLFFLSVLQVFKGQLASKTVQEMQPRKKSGVLPDNKQYHFCLSGNYSSDVICITCLFNSTQE